MKLFVICLSLLFSLAAAFTEAGPYNVHYTIPFYYGSRYKERSSKSVILYDNATQFYWSHSFNQDYLRNLWVADKAKSTIIYISKEKLAWNALFKVTGKEYVQGYIDGSLDNALFNTTTSICVYD